MKVVRNVAFPDADTFMAGELDLDGSYQLSHLVAAMRHVTNWTCAVDGGAHIGTWSVVMSRAFQRVIAAEPSPDTFECLAWNLFQTGCVNVEIRPVALGQQAGTVAMHLTADQAARGNTGARFIRPGGTIAVETIDSWALPSLGFLKLDVEGSEHAALCGAEATLRRCRPVVLFENKWLWTKTYGLPKDVVAQLLTACGYRFAEQVSRDQIWVPKP
jgi:methyltransferase, FkbM family